jgi:RimJ/RimL family protein N-acetyltransferase
VRRHALGCQGRVIVIQAPEVFTTDRLVLRRPSLSDTADIHEYASDPEVTRYMDWRTHTDIRESVEFLEACALRWESRQEFCWVVTIRPGTRVVGAVACRVRGHAVDFGYVLNRQCWGQGYATEAAGVIAVWAISLPGVYRVWATCDGENLASVRVLEKIGLSREGLMRCCVIRPNLSEKPRDNVVFARVKGDMV